MRWSICFGLLSLVGLVGCGGYSHAITPPSATTTTTTEETKTTEEVKTPVERWVTNKASNQRGLVIAYSHWDSKDIKVRLANGQEVDWWAGEYTEDAVPAAAPVTTTTVTKPAVYEKK